MSTILATTIATGVLSDAAAVSVKASVTGIKRATHSVIKRTRRLIARIANPVDAAATREEHEEYLGCFDHLTKLAVLVGLLPMNPMPRMPPTLMPTHQQLCDSCRSYLSAIEVGMFGPESKLLSWHSEVTGMATPAISALIEKAGAAGILLNSGDATDVYERASGVTAGEFAIQSDAVRKVGKVLRRLSLPVGMVAASSIVLPLPCDVHSNMIGSPKPTSVPGVLTSNRIGDWVGTMHPEMMDGLAVREFSFKVNNISQDHGTTNWVHAENMVIKPHPSGVDIDPTKTLNTGWAVISSGGGNKMPFQMIAPTGVLTGKVPYTRTATSIVSTTVAVVATALYPAGTLSQVTKSYSDTGWLIPGVATGVSSTGFTFTSAAQGQPMSYDASLIDGGWDLSFSGTAWFQHRADEIPVFMMLLKAPNVTANNVVGSTIALRMDKMEIISTVSMRAIPVGNPSVRIGGRWMECDPQAPMTDYLALAEMNPAEAYPFGTLWTWVGAMLPTLHDSLGALVSLLHQYPNAVFRARSAGVALVVAGTAVSDSLVNRVFAGLVPVLGAPIVPDLNHVLAILSMLTSSERNFLHRYIVENQGLLASNLSDTSKDVAAGMD